MDVSELPESDSITEENKLEAVKQLTRYFIDLRGTNGLILPEHITEDNCVEAVKKLNETTIEYYRSQGYTIIHNDEEKTVTIEPPTYH